MRTRYHAIRRRAPGCTAPDDVGVASERRGIYIVTDNVKAPYEEYSALSKVKISRPLFPQEYGMMEFDVMDLNDHRLVFAQPIRRSKPWERLAPLGQPSWFS